MWQRLCWAALIFQAACGHSGPSPAPATVTPPLRPREQVSAQKILLSGFMTRPDAARIVGAGGIGFAEAIALRAVPAPVKVTIAKQVFTVRVRSLTGCTDCQNRLAKTSLVVGQLFHRSDLVVLSEPAVPPELSDDVMLVVAGAAALLGKTWRSDRTILANVDELGILQKNPGALPSQGRFTEIGMPSQLISEPSNLTTILAAGTTTKPLGDARQAVSFMLEVHLPRPIAFSNTTAAAAQLITESLRAELFERSKQRVTQLATCWQNLISVEETRWTGAATARVNAAFATMQSALSELDAGNLVLAYAQIESAFPLLRASCYLKPLLVRNADFWEYQRLLSVESSVAQRQGGLVDNGGTSVGQRMSDWLFATWLEMFRNPSPEGPLENPALAPDPDRVPKQTQAAMADLWLPRIEKVVAEQFAIEEATWLAEKMPNSLSLPPSAIAPQPVSPSARWPRWKDLTGDQKFFTMPPWRSPWSVQENPARQELQLQKRAADEAMSMVSTLLGRPPELIAFRYALARSLENGNTPALQRLASASYRLTAMQCWQILFFVQRAALQ